MTSSTLATALLASLVIPSLPSPEGELLPTDARGPGTPIFEWSDYAGEHSMARAKITYKEARDWCENWRPGDEAEMKACANDLSEAEKDVVHEASANCKTGVIKTTWGDTYTFAGIDNQDENFNGSLLFMDENGQVHPLNYASGALGVAAQWLTLCPFGHPYDIVPLKMVMDQDDRSGLGGIIGFEDRTLIQDDVYGIITYGDEEDIGIKDGTVFFRGHWIRGAGIEGIAFSFKEACEPVGYRVSGYDQGISDEISLQGEAPIWGDKCEIKGYSREVPGWKLTFHLPHH